MLLEIAEIEIKPGREDDFAAAMRDGGLTHLASCEGVIDARFGRGVENPSKFLFHVVWTSMEAHVAARDLAGFQAFRTAFGDLSCGGSMSHYVLDDSIPGASA